MTRSMRSIRADVSKESDVEGMFHQLGERFGRLDVLVTTASVWQPKKLEELTAEDVRFNFDVNTLGTFLCVRCGGLMMVGSGKDYGKDDIQRRRGCPRNSER